MTMSAYAAYSLCLGGMLIAATKLADSEAVGQFALGLAVATPIVMFCNLQLRAAQVTDSIGRFEDGEYLALRLITTGVALCAIALAAVGIAGFSNGSAVMAAAGSAKCFEALGDNLQGLLQRTGRMGSFSMSLLLKSVFSLLGFGGTLAMGGSMVLACLVYAATIAAITALYDWPRARRLAPNLRPRWNLPRLRILARTALPLGVAALLSAGVAQIPKYAVTFYCGTREFAVFAAVTFLVSGAQILASAMGQAALPKLAQFWFNGSLPEFRALLLAMTAIVTAVGLLGTAIAALAGGELLGFLYRPEYADHAGLLQIVMAGITVLSISWVLTNALQAARLFREQMMVFGAGSLATLLAAAALVPTYRLAGAAMAMLLGSAVQVAGSAAILWFESAQASAVPAALRNR
jgi:O-antigen/teichoic acid export membrane protein